MPAKADDLSIADDVVIYRGVTAAYLSVDAAGNEVFSDGVFRSKEISAFRSDQASASEVFAEYPAAVRIVQISARQIRAAGRIVIPDDPPRGHLNIYRSDILGKGLAVALPVKWPRVLSFSR